MKIRLSLLGILAVVLVGSATSSSIAEEKSVGLDVKTRLIGESDVDKMAGELEIVETDMELFHQIKIADQLPVKFSFEYHRVDIDDDGVPVHLPSHLQGWAFGVGTKVPAPFAASDQHFIGLEVYPSMYTEDLEWEDSAFRVPFNAYWIYKYSAELIFVAGTSVRIDSDTPVLPIVGLIYKPNDRLHFHLVPDEPNISYKLDDRTTAFMEFDGSYEEYEVKRGTDENVILKYRSVSTGLGVKYALCKYSEVSASFGGVLGRQFRYEDDGGKVAPDGALYGKVKLALRF